MWRPEALKCSKTNRYHELTCKISATNPAAWPSLKHHHNPGVCSPVVWDGIKPRRDCDDDRRWFLTFKLKCHKCLFRRWLWIFLQQLKSLGPFTPEQKWRIMGSLMIFIQGVSSTQRDSGRSNRFSTGAMTGTLSTCVIRDNLNFGVPAQRRENPPTPWRSRQFVV